MVIIKIVFHLIFSFILFFFINFFGKKSSFYGYEPLNFENDQFYSPAFNFVYKILGPSIFLFIISAFFYVLNFNFLIENIYFVSVFYILLRIFYKFFFDRVYLTNWKKEILNDILIILFSLITYFKLLKNKNLIIPDIKSLSNELWLLIILYIYSIFNYKNYSTSQRDDYVKKNYIIKMAQKLKKNFSKILNEIEDPNLKNIILSIMIYENFNRPKFIRILENKFFFFSKKSRTTGIMQVKSIKPLSDEESLKEGLKILIDLYKKIDLNNIELIFYGYNPDESYVNQVSSIYYILSSTKN